MDSSNDDSWCGYLCASALMYSTLANPRLLESSTHALWNIFCWDLCGGNAKSLLPTPQWNIYVSPKDNISNDPGNITKGDSNADGVITDFCVLLPFYTVGNKPEAHTRSQATRILVMAQMKAFLQNWKTPWRTDRWRELFPDIRLAYLAAPVLMELKRPITRHAKDIFHFVKIIFSRLNEAASQVHEQATCLFCSVKYANQKQVIVIIGAGEFYCYKVISKDSLPQDLQWRYDQYASTYVGNNILDNLDNVNFDEDILEGDNIDDQNPEEDYMEPDPLVPSVSQDGIDQALAEVVATHTERSRELRGKHRQNAKEILYSAQQDYRKLLTETQDEGHIYTHSELQNAYDILQRLGVVESDLGPLRFDKTTTPLAGEWSHVTHVGSQCSNIYVDHIKQAMRKAAKGNVYFV